MEKTSNLLIKLSRRLFTESCLQEKFVTALTQPQPFQPCVLWCREKPNELPFLVASPTDWQPYFIDRLALDSKPGQHSLHNSGYYYCLDFSSVFAAAILLAISSPVKVVFDMCAAPGGKGIFAWRVFQPELLIANEVIGKRLGMLISNLKRCQIQPSVVVNRDSSILAEMFAQTSDLVIVDAPCTGQSLLAKGEKAVGCFHPTNINQCANRQKRIIANSAKIVAPQGYLAYMTCTYSPEENEEVCQWLLKKFPHFQAVEIEHLRDYRSHLTTLPCYRIWPQDGLGAGAFAALFKNTEQSEANQLDLDALESSSIVRF
ncbi:Fmu (Sun) domain-containing protein [[Phormidium ambiguum] IAM M-71]|uniref:Fmu (Sun) domain-containing protein n=1 Tax=[Phormidium ambiguum] IAM M-71 TaxID=454136 RepID=A0A1U7IBJ2_9CYAN|nr:RsmB/NOP family class I SAM-dependent RNA methyltransferase [Phormidium ambiguum]OKH33923.1 Fmu (Sun) domain-containing protein [Phormidium ambiguum IAM M-71]